MIETSPRRTKQIDVAAEQDSTAICSKHSSSCFKKLGFLAMRNHDDPQVTGAWHLILYKLQALFADCLQKVFSIKGRTAIEVAWTLPKERGLVPYDCKMSSRDRIRS